MEKSIFSRCYTFRSSDKVLNVYQHFKRGEEMGRFEYYPKSKAECIGCPDRDKCDAQTSHLILVDCKSFYYTYNLLEPYNRMPELTENEEQQKEIMEQYLEEHEKHPILLFPWIVNGALAAELALKFLTFRETKSFETTHDLRKLYRQLPTVHKSELLERLKIQAHQNEETLTQNLESFAEAFVCFRYPFGRGSFGINGIFHDFVKIVCEYAFEFDEPDDCEAEK